MAHSFRVGLGWGASVALRAPFVPNRTHRLVPAIAATIPEAAIDKLMKNPLVSHIEEDIKVYAVDTELDNSWGVKRIGAGTVHDSSNLGTDVKVAVIDSGIDYKHADLDANYIGGYDYVNDDYDPMDDNGHGTHVAGTIAAKDNGLGVVGVAPEAQLYALKVLDASGSGDYSDVIAALQWCVAGGIQVTNNSYGSSGDPGTDVKNAFEEAYRTYGILHVAAAGNSGNLRGTGDNVIYPARWESLIAVAATDSNDKRASFSSTGPAVELAAPGVSIYSTMPGNKYGTKSGTSMASPHVAGAATLVIWEGLDNGFTLSPGEVRNILNSTAVDLGTSGRDSLYGYGRVDALKAFNAASSLAPPEPAVNVSLSTDKTSYESGTDTKAELTAVVSDEYGEAISGLVPVFFVTKVGDHVVEGNFSETTPQGTYQGSLYLSDLAEGNHVVEVTVTNPDAISGTGSTTVTIEAISTDPLMTVSEITYATEGRGKHLLVTVWVEEKGGVQSPVSGAAVSIDLYLDNTKRSSSSGTTGSNGGVTFKYVNAPSGTYSTEVTSVTHSNYSWDGEYPPNRFEK